MDMPERIGHYSIRGRLGDGAMGVVFEARQENPSRDVALKVLRGGAFVDDARLKMFQREAETLARLRHPCIAAIYESGHTDDGQHFFAMERVHGEQLDDYLQRRPQRPDNDELRFRLGLFRKIVDAVHYAHMRGVIHRDLKPSNIMVGDGVDQQGLPEIKVLDFGLARITETDMPAATVTTEVGVIKGTLPYMSPEQTRGNPDEIDVRTDVYALGVILYELLTGQRPYEVSSGDILDAMRVICDAPPAPVSRHWTGVRRLDADIETIVAEALEKDPERRYGSAQALADDVGRFLNNEAINARPATAIYQLKKLVSRHKVPFAFVVLLFVTVSAFGVWMSVLYARAEGLRVETEAARSSLQTTTQFQQSMLSDIDAEEMGRGILAAERASIREAMAREGRPPDEIAPALASFDELVTGVNATDLALQVVEDHVLARAVETLERDFADEPVTRAALQYTIAITYKGLGMYELAVPLQQAALATQREALGADHAATLSSLNNMGSLLRRQGKLEQAMPYYADSLARKRRTLGNDHRETLLSINNMALLLDLMGRPDDAERYYREALAGNRRALGNDDPETINTINNLCVLHQRHGQSEKALPYAREAVAGLRRVVGDDDPRTLTAMGNLGPILFTLGKTAEAEPYHRDSLAASRRIQGDNHPETMRLLHNMGRLLNALGEHDEAARILADGEATARRTWTGTLAKWLGSYLHHLGAARLGLGRLAESEATLLEAHALLVAGFGDEHPRTQLTVEQLSQLYDTWHRAEPGKGYDATATEWRAKLVR